MERKTIEVTGQGVAAGTRAHAPGFLPSAADLSTALKVQGRTHSSW